MPREMVSLTSGKSIFTLDRSVMAGSLAVILDHEVETAWREMWSNEIEQTWISYLAGTTYFQSYLQESHKSPPYSGYGYFVFL